MIDRECVCVCARAALKKTKNDVPSTKIQRRATARWQVTRPMWATSTAVVPLLPLHSPDALPPLVLEIRWIGSVLTQWAPVRRKWRGATRSLDCFCSALSSADVPPSVLREDAAHQREHTHERCRFAMATPLGLLCSRRRLCYE